MYDWEIQNFLAERNHRLESKEYIYLCDTCPQINHVKYNPYGNYFEVWTDSSYFKFEVYCNDIYGNEKKEKQNE